MRYEDCWFWDGGYGPTGYGRAHSPRLSDTIAAHRMVYEELVEIIPPGLQLDHLCRKRSCVNPYHLRIMTGRENLLAPGSKAIAALNAAKTHCHRGHAFDATNTYNAPGGHRHCRACRLIRRESERRMRSARRNHPIRDAACSLGAGEAVSTGVSSPANNSVMPPEASADKFLRDK